MSRTQPAPRRVVLVDLDGTLVGPAGVPDSAWRALDRGRARGLVFAVCTGRGGRGEALGYAARLAPEGPHVLDAGASILRGDGLRLHAERLSAALVERALGWARAGGHDLEVYTAEGRFLVSGPSEGVAAHSALLEVPAEVVGAEVLLDPALWVVRAQLLVAPGRDVGPAAIEAERGGEAALHLGTSPRMPGWTFAGLTAPGVSKLSGARWVARHYGLDLDRVAMIGDGDNDREVVGGVGLGIAMGNATPGTRAAAKHVVASVEADGFAEAVDYLIHH